MAGSIYAEPKPSEAAELLDPLNLPVGTFIAWTTDKGFSGADRNRGTIEKVTDRSYVVKSWIGDTGRIERTISGTRSRRLRVLRTPEEQVAFLADQVAERERRNAVHAEQKAAADERARQSEAEAYALLRLREQHEAEFQQYVEKYLDPTQGI